MFEALAHDLVLILEVVPLLLHGPQLLFGLEVLADLGLQASHSLSKTRVALDVVCVALLQQVVLRLNSLVLSERDRQSQFGEEELDLLNSLCLPFLEFIDACLHMHVLVGKISLAIVIVTSQQVFLLR